MVSEKNLSLVGILTAVSLAVGSTTGTFSLFDRFEQSEEQLENLNNQVALLEAQLEDTRHENIITRIENAKEILNNCEMTIEEKNIILEILGEGVKEATLYQNFDRAENLINSVIVDLKDCRAYIPYYEKTS